MLEGTSCLCLHLQSWFARASRLQPSPHVPPLSASAPEKRPSAGGARDSSHSDLEGIAPLLHHGVLPSCSLFPPDLHLNRQQRGSSRSLRQGSRTARLRPPHVLRATGDVSGAVRCTLPHVCPPHGSHLTSSKWPPPSTGNAAEASAVSLIPCRLASSLLFTQQLGRPH